MRTHRNLIACLLLAAAAVPFTARLHAADADVAAVGVRAGGELTAGELADLLGAHVWKLDVALPSDARNVSVTLIQQSKGKAPVPFGPGIQTPLREDAKRQLLIAVVPVGGGDLGDAERVTVTVQGFGMFARQTYDNPLRKMAVGGPADAPEPAGDGVFHLLGGYAGGTVSSPVSTADTLLSVRIESH